MLHDNISIGENGHLFFAGMDAVRLAEKHGTPLYLIDEDKLRANCREYYRLVKKHFGDQSVPLYASKALCYLDLYRILKQEKLGIDVVSAGEIFTALEAGFPAELMVFHGNNKTDADIEYAVGKGVGIFAVDNREELEQLDETAGKHNIRQKILLRLSPGIDPHTHEAMMTGSVDSKYGSAIETGQAMQITELALTKKNVRLLGFHCHIGSLIYDLQPFSDAARIMLGFIADVKKRLGFEAEMLNLGGGAGVKYKEENPDFDLDINFGRIKAEIDAFCARQNVRQPVILFEMGRYICANAGMTLYTVGSFKSITGYKNYISVDGGMPDNPRYILYKSDYTVENASRANEEKSVIATIAGRCCESGDYLQEKAAVQPCARGDILAVLCTGAYNYSMASNYNRLPRPPLVCIKDKTDRIAVKRETLGDLIKNEV